MSDADRIDVDFVLTGQYIDLEIISSQTGMKPSIWRTKEDWPETIANGDLMDVENLINSIKKETSNVYWGS